MDKLLLNCNIFPRVQVAAAKSRAEVMGRPEYFDEQKTNQWFVFYAHELNYK